MKTQDLIENLDKVLNKLRDGQIPKVSFTGNLVEMEKEANRVKDDSITWSYNMLIFIVNNLKTKGIENTPEK